MLMQAPGQKSGPAKPVCATAGGGAKVLTGRENLCAPLRFRGQAAVSGRLSGFRQAASPPYNSLANAVRGNSKPAHAGAERTSIMKLSARNQIKGKITEVKKGATTSHVLIDAGG
jgi:hypothetical protein